MKQELEDEFDDFKQAEDPKPKELT